MTIRIKLLNPQLRRARVMFAVEIPRLLQDEILLKIRKQV